MVQLKTVENMFWALVLEEGKRYSQTVEQSFHISMAALELPSDAETLKGRHHQTVSVMVASQKSEFLICSLNFKHLTQQPLDLNFNEGEEVTFFVNGQGTVHLTGYQLEDDKDFADMEGFDLGEEEDDEDSDNEVPELVTPGKRKKDSQAMLPKKKTKWLTPGGSEFSEDDDEDSDEDDDYSDDDINASDLLDMEAQESDDEDDDDFEIDDDVDDDDDSEEEESDEEMVEVIKPKQNQQKGKETPKQQKQKKEKQTPQPEQSKAPKQDLAKTPKQDQNKAPKQDKKDQNQKSATTTKPGAGGDAESSQSAKKKKKKKKKNKNLENGEQEQGGKTPQPNTPKPGQKQQTPGQKQQTPGQKQQTPGQKQQTPGQKQQTPGQKQQTPGQKQQTPGQKQQNQQQGKTPQQSKTPQPNKTPKKQVLGGGIIAEDIHVGDGQPAKKGKMAHVYYVGKLQKDGRQFDSCTSGKPFKFKLGLGEVIQGWDKGVEGMKLGGKRRLTIPPQQGYGNQRSGPIPPNSTLVFEVELKNVS